VIFNTNGCIMYEIWMKLGENRNQFNYHIIPNMHIHFQYVIIISHIPFTHTHTHTHTYTHMHVYIFIYIRAQYTHTHMHIVYIFICIRLLYNSMMYFVFSQFYSFPRFRRWRRKWMKTSEDKLYYECYRVWMMLLLHERIQLVHNGGA
jgi:hypothetical protein